MTANRSGLVALAFPSYNSTPGMRAGDSKRRANHFGSLQQLGESMMVAKDTFGYLVPANSPLTFMSTAKTYGGKILPMVTKDTPKEESGEELVKASTDPKNKDMGKTFTGEKGSMANANSYGKTIPIKEGAWIKVEGSLEACRFTMSGTTPVKSEEGEIQGGFYFVMGINERAGVATLSRHKIVKEYLYNVDLDKLEFGEAEATKEEAAQYTMKRYKTVFKAYKKLAGQLKSVKGKEGEGATKDRLQAKMRKARVLAHTLAAARKGQRGDTVHGEAATTTPAEIKPQNGGVAKKQVQEVSKGAKVNPKSTQTPDSGATKKVEAVDQKKVQGKLTLESNHAHGLKVLEALKRKGFQTNMASSTAARVLADNREAISKEPTKAVDINAARPISEAELATLQQGAKAAVKDTKPLPNNLQSALQAFRGSMVNAAQQSVTPEFAKSLSEAQTREVTGTESQDPVEFAKANGATAVAEAPSKTVETTEVMDPAEESEADLFTAKSEEAVPGDYTPNMVALLKSRGYNNAEQIAAAVSEGKPAEQWFGLTGGSLQDAKRLLWEITARKNRDS